MRALAVAIGIILVLAIGAVAWAEPQIQATSKAFIYGQPVCFTPCRVAFEARLDGPVTVTPDGQPAVIWTIKPAEPSPGEVRVGVNYIGTSLLHTFNAPGAYLVVLDQIGADGTVLETQMVITVMEQSITAKILSIADTVLRFLTDVIGLLPIKIIIGGV